MYNFWYQSITDLSRLPGYHSAMDSHIKNIIHQHQLEIQFCINGTSPNTYPDDQPPVQYADQSYIQKLLEVQLIENAFKARQQGFHGFALTCFLDPGLPEIRTSVQLPTVSACESSLMLALTRFSRIEVVTIADSMIPRLKVLLERYIGTRPAQVHLSCLPEPINELDIDAAFKGNDTILNNIIGLYHDHLANRCTEALIPAEGAINLLFAKNNITQIHNSAVIDSLSDITHYLHAVARQRPLPAPNSFNGMGEATLNTFRKAAANHLLDR